MSVTNTIPKVLLFFGFGLLVGCSFDSMGLAPGGPERDITGPLDLGPDMGDAQPDVATDGPLPDVATDGPLPDVAVDGPLPDVTKDGPLPDVTKDGPLPDVAGDGPLPDSLPDLPPPDAAVDLPGPDAPQSDTTPWPDVYPWPDTTSWPDVTPHLDVPLTDIMPAPCTGYVCPLGCNAKENRCYRLKPSNFDAKAFFSLVSDVTFTSTTVVINTSTGEIKDGNTVRRAAGSAGTVNKGIYWGVVKQKGGYPDIAVFGVKNLNVGTTTTITVTGSRALAIYASANVFLDGKIVAVGSGATPGPGGFAGGAVDGKSGATCHGGEGKGGRQEGWLTPRRSGAGGGGRGKAGGSGGKGTGVGKDASGGGGGKAVGKKENAPLFGGCGGGGGKGNRGGKGGGGGGAVQISANGTVAITGVIHVGGAGGEGGHSASGSGGGGGSGGAILLESSSILVSKGLLAANGGGGGCGSALVANAPSGENGKASTSAAKGGDSFWEVGDGGSGGARAKEAGAGGASAYRGGGGGGAAGRIRVNGLTISVGTSNASPAPTAGTKIDKW